MSCRDDVDILLERIDTLTEAFRVRVAGRRLPEALYSQLERTRQGEAEVRTRHQARELT